MSEDFIPDNPDFLPEEEPAPIPWRDHLLTSLFALWLVGLSLFFFLRFSLVFYYDNREAINALFSN